MKKLLLIFIAFFVVSCGVKNKEIEDIQSFQINNMTMSEITTNIFTGLVFTGTNAKNVEQINKEQNLLSTYIIEILSNQGKQVQSVLHGMTTININENDIKWTKQEQDGIVSVVASFDNAMVVIPVKYENSKISLNFKDDIKVIDANGTNVSANLKEILYYAAINKELEQKDQLSNVLILWVNKTLGE